MYGGYDREKEIREAIYAGERALSKLHDAENRLSSAGNWGLLDIFGGNGLSGMMKHIKIDGARRDLEDAKRELMSFSRELKDVRGIENINIDISGFVTFADFFFDGFLADIFVQSKISDAKNDVREAIRRVEDILRTLRSQL